MESPAASAAAGVTRWQQARHALPFLALGALNLAAIDYVITHWGEPRTFHGSLLDLVGSAAFVLTLVAAIHRRSASPLRTPAAALLVGNTVYDTLLLSGWGPQSASPIGSFQLAVEAGWIAIIVLLYLDRPSPAR